MNSLETRAVKIGTQFAAQFRRIHKAEFETVQENGRPVLFSDWRDAKLAAWETMAMVSHMTSLMRRDGETISDAKRTAESYFKTGKADELVCSQHNAGSADAAPGDVERNRG